jgi:hypothetical protein
MPKMIAELENSMTHRPAWLAFHRAARKDPSAVSIWHETARERLDTSHA